jgi:hypothetical protein
VSAVRGWLADVVLPALAAVLVVALATVAIWWRQGRALEPVLPHIYQPWTFETEYAPGIPVCPATDALGVCQPRQV